MKNLSCQSAKCYQVVWPNVRLILLFKAVDVDGAILLFDENDRPGTAGLTSARARNALLDHPSAQIGIDHAFIRAPGGCPKVGVRDASLAGKPGEWLALIDRQRLGAALAPARSIALSATISDIPNG